MKKILFCLVLFVLAANVRCDEEHVLDETHQEPVEQHEHTMDECLSLSERFTRNQMLVQNLTEPVRLSLTNKFRTNLDCLSKMFELTLGEMRTVYEQASWSAQLANETSITSSASFVESNSSSEEEKDEDAWKKMKSALKKQHKKMKQAKKQQQDPFLSQTGVVFYSIGQNHTVSHFWHESFRFMKSVNETSTHLNQTELETQRESLENEMGLLKNLINSLKFQAKQLSKRMKLMKLISKQSEEVLKH